jgi:hypothetical protein
MPLRRQLLRFAGASVAASALPRAAFAFEYPTRAARSASSMLSHMSAPQNTEDSQKVAA